MTNMSLDFSALKIKLDKSPYRRAGSPVPIRNGPLKHLQDYSKILQPIIEHRNGAKAKNETKTSDN